MLVAVILTVGIARGRRLLIRSIVEGEYAQNLSHFVPASVAAQITQAEGPLIDAQTERREASILFIDLVSFTSLAEQLPAEQLIKTLNEYFSVISKPIERHHGVINQFHGDAILASFNLPSKDPDHACSAVTAALEIQETLHHYRFQDGIVLKTRAGINTGEVVGGFVGTPNHLSYTVYGDDVNIAARLQELSKEHGTSNLISLRTRQLCRSDKLRFITKGEEAIRGRQATVEVYEARFKQGKF
jgi:adenylate cyclase